MTNKVDSNLNTSNRGFILVVGTLLVVGIAVVALVATRSDSATEAAGEQTAAVEITGENIPRMPEGLPLTDASTDPAYGTVAPTLTGTSFDGTEVTIEADGTAKAIYFVAHWCPHCQDEVPVVQELIDNGSVPDGMQIYAVSTAVDAGRGNYPPEDWFEAEEFTGVVVRDDAPSTSFSTFGGASFPYAVYLNADNEIVARTAGSVDAAVTQQLWDLAAG